jgi:hypothetical protein
MKAVRKKERFKHPCSTVPRPNLEVRKIKPLPGQMELPFMVGAPTVDIGSYTATPKQAKRKRGSRKSSGT